MLQTVCGSFRPSLKWEGEVKIDFFPAQLLCWWAWHWLVLLEWRRYCLCLHWCPQDVHLLPPPLLPLLMGLWLPWHCNCGWWWCYRCMFWYLVFLCSSLHGGLQHGHVHLVVGGLDQDRGWVLEDGWKWDPSLWGLVKLRTYFHFNINKCATYTNIYS